jgi:hypothetical protein
LKDKSANKEKKGQDDSEWGGLHEKIYCPNEYNSFSNINVDNYVKNYYSLLLSEENLPVLL